MKAVTITCQRSAHAIINVFFGVLECKLSVLTYVHAMPRAVGQVNALPWCAPNAA